MIDREYRDSLQPPSTEEIRRISDIQIHKEEEIFEKYHDAREEAAATTIQAAYRGHRERRHMDGLTLDPSARWMEAIRELRYRIATLPHYSASSSAPHDPSASPSDVARSNWRRVTSIAEHAGGGNASPSPSRRTALPHDNQPSTATSASKSAPSSMLLDLRYFLEMVDRKHRYGSNLQVYHEAWLREDTNQNFFYWLDHGAGRHLSLAGCSRETLDRERIRYLTTEQRLQYLVEIDDAGKLRWAKDGQLISTDNQLFKDSAHGIVRKTSDDSLPSSTSPGDTDDHSDRASFSSDSEDGNTDDRSPQEAAKAKRRFHISPATMFNHLLRATVKAGTWIYVADTSGRLYISIKSSGAFQHASFMSGARISSAGSIEVTDGQLVSLSPLSGHYRPTTKSFRDFVAHLKDEGVDMSELHVSHAYRVLQGMELYDRTRRGLTKVVHPTKEGRG